MQIIKWILLAVCVLMIIWPLLARDPKHPTENKGD